MRTSGTLNFDQDQKIDVAQPFCSQPRRVGHVLNVGACRQTPTMLGLSIPTPQPKKSLDLAQLQTGHPSKVRLAPPHVVTSDSRVRLASPSSRRAAAL